MHDDDIVDTTEMYLKAVLELEEEGVEPIRARIADRLGHATPTVSKTVERIVRDGLLELTEDRHVSLTPAGRERAVAVMRKHRVAEVFLDRVIGLEWEQLHQEACRWEHVMSDRVEHLLGQLLEHPELTPYGNPVYASDVAEPVGSNLVRAVVGRTEPLEATIAWIGEPLQADPGALESLSRNDIVPGLTARFAAHGPAVIAELSPDERVELPHELAAHIFVVAPR